MRGCNQDEFLRRSIPAIWGIAVLSEHGEDHGDIGAPSDVRRTAEELLPLFYEEVRRAARRERRRVGAGETLQTTALIHEAYLKLHRSPGFNDEAHFMRAAALAMRHSLINYARDRVAAKRGSGAKVVAIEEAGEIGEAADQELLEINEALVRLARLSPRLAQVVECRFFAGYGDDETARALGLTDRTVRRDWIKARAWLRRELADPESVALLSQ
jgi:RNA polymerase sigma factor (TIGR02999 family)